MSLLLVSLFLISNILNLFLFISISVGVSENILKKDCLLYSLSENNEVLLFSLFSFDENKLLLLSSKFENKEFLLLLLIFFSNFNSFFELSILFPNKDELNNLVFVLLVIVELFDIFSSFLLSIILFSDFLVFSSF